MRRWITLALALASATPALRAQGKQFEGTVTFQSSAESGAEGTFDYSVKGNLVRMDMNARGNSMYIITDADAHKMMMVMPAQNMYMERDLPDMDAASAAEGKDVKPVNTGRTDTVAGHRCEIWTLTSEEHSFEMCVARDMGVFASPGGANPMRRRPPPAWEAELRKGGFFPLRVVRTSGGSPVTVLEATKIEPKSLDASFFKPPADARQMTMPPGMGGGRRP